MNRLKNALDITIHKFLRFPYGLNVRYVRNNSPNKPLILFVHGLGATAEMWQPILQKMPQDSNYLAVDLLGFGESPNPYWETYDAKLQSRSLYSVCKKYKTPAKIIVVGHSLGALVAVDFAKRYQSDVMQLVLCSPPMYRDDPSLKFTYDRLLRNVYGEFLEDKEALMKVYKLGKTTKIDPTLQVDEQNIEMLASALRASIINQTTLQDIKTLPMPIEILYGIFDPLIVAGNVQALKKEMKNVRVTKLAAAHTINSLYATKLQKILNTILKS